LALAPGASCLAQERSYAMARCRTNERRWAVQCEVASEVACGVSSVSDSKAAKIDGVRLAGLAREEIPHKNGWAALGCGWNECLYQTVRIEQAKE
jgi:hypothetical protein